MLLICSVLVLKKLGEELFQELLEVINYLARVEKVRVIVEPHEFKALVSYLQICFRIKSISITAHILCIWEQMPEQPAKYSFTMQIIISVLFLPLGFLKHSRSGIQFTFYFIMRTTCNFKKGTD